MKTSASSGGGKKARHQAPLPEPGRKKKNPRDLDKLLDKGIEDSMAASDPPAAVQPEVHTEPDREGESVESGRDERGKHKI